MNDLNLAERIYFDGVALSDAAEYGRAERKFAAALALAPGRASILASLSAVLLMQGKVSEAKSHAEGCVAVDPDHAEGWLNLGICLSSEKGVARALGCFDKAIANNPDMVQARLARAGIFDDLGWHTEALDDYRRATLLDPGISGAWIGCGGALYSLGRFAEALTCFEQAAAIDSGSVEALANAGAALLSLERFDAALAYLRRAISLDAEFAQAWSLAGNALYALGHYEEALAHYDRAIALDGGFGEALYNRANVLRQLKRPDEALADYERADALSPDIPYALGQYLHTKMQMCAWNGLEGLETRLAEGIRSGRQCAIPFTVLAAPLTGAEFRACATTYAGSKFAALAAAPFRHAPDGVAAAPTGGEDRPLRIGYLSADFRTHPVAFLIAGVLEHHDRSAFEIFLYSCGPTTDDPEQLRLKAACRVFRDISTLPDSVAADLIAGDGIDLLVDLMGITKGHRLGINALRPTSVIVNWLGYPASLGDVRLADYILGDPVVTPLAHAEHFSEAIAQMPHCYQPNDRSRVIGPRPTRAAAGLPPDAFVFCSFNQSFKITPAVFDLWCRLLAEIPDSVLWLAIPHRMAIDNLRREAAARRIDVHRLIFAPHVPTLADHLARLQLADLALDTFPYTSHTTGSDALWAGVPLVTRIGESYVSRVAASLLPAVDLPELVTADEESCFLLARALALDPPRLAELRKRLEVHRLTSPLFDTARFARDLEALYRRMWSQHLRGSRSPIAAVRTSPSSDGGADFVGASNEVRRLQATETEQMARFGPIGVTPLTL